MKKHDVEPSEAIVALKTITLVDGKPSRICDGCGVIITYATMKGYEGSCRIGTRCRKCGNTNRSTSNVPEDLSRKCPTCSATIVYKDDKCWRQAERANRGCRTCAKEATRATTRSEAWKQAHSKSLESVFNSEEYRLNLSVSQRERVDDRSPGALKSAATRRKNGQQERITQLTHTPEANAKRRASHLELRRTNPELWKTDKARAGWIVSGEKGKTYIDKAIRAAQSGNKRSVFERSFDEPLRALGFLPTQQVDRWWVDYLNHETKVVVECYGDWHHCHPKYDEKITKKYGGVQPELEMSPADKRLRDEERVRDIESRGYTVVVIWQHDSKRWLSWIESSLVAPTEVS